MAVLKAEASEASVRAMPRRSVASPAPVQPAAEALALARAEREIARLTSRIEDIESKAIRSEQEALARGRIEGAADAEKAADARANALRDALVAACAAWDSRLQSLDALAPELARSALAKMFEPSADLAGLTTRAIRRQVAQLAERSAVAIVVSKADFADVDALAETVGVPRDGGTTLLTSSELAAGECRIELQLGERSIGPVDQWRALSTFLEQLAAS